MGGRLWRGQRRFIPARAGNTPGQQRHGRPRTVHPRSRGKYLGVGHGDQVVVGSSPLAREIRAQDVQADLGRRFIPARAGNTSPWRLGPLVVRFIPARAGNTFVFRKSWRPHCGSSPLAREIPGRSRHVSRLLRFIPARAGNTRPSHWQRPRRPVHPRSRGKYREGVGAAGAPGGSSPLAREILGQLRRRHRLPRFIPARAGNTSPRRPASPPASAHPRSRGKYADAMQASTGTGGSSPLAREILGAISHDHQHDRFIPARAGNTTAPRPSRCPRPVHPRSRGKYVVRTPLPSRTWGSSPLAREIPVDRFRGLPLGRFIPARAGNTASRAPQGGSSRFIPARAGNTSMTAKARTAKSVHPRSRGKYM